MKQTTVALLVIAVVVCAAYALDRGIYLGSTSEASDGLVHKNCRYLFVTGIVSLPAHGAILEQFGVMRGIRLENAPDNLYCRLFAE